jgi:NADH dehydrogenase FAD-containing subunit
MGRELVFIGAGHAHLTAISNLTNYVGRGGHVTVISPGAYQYYSGMGPGMFSGIYKPQEVRFNVKRLTESRGGKFIDDHVVSVDPEKRQLSLAGGNTVNYDVACFGIGSEIETGPIDTSYENVYKAKPVEQLFKARCRIVDTLKTANKPLDLVIIGGGATGVEIACNAWRLSRGLDKTIHITLITKGKILSRFPAAVRKKALKKMRRFGITVEEDIPVKGNTGEKFLLEDGRDISFNFAVVTTGTKPPDLFVKSSLPTGEDGGLLVNRYLQSVRYPEIFGGGDCISFEPTPLDRVGVYAVRQNPILLENLEAALVGEPLTAFDPQAVYLLILNMGDGTGIFNRKSLTLGGGFAFKLKNNLDKKFMEEFQVSGELNDDVDCNE